MSSLVTRQELWQRIIRTGEKKHKMSIMRNIIVKNNPRVRALE